MSENEQKAGCVDLPELPEPDFMSGDYTAGETAYTAEQMHAYARAALEAAALSPAPPDVQVLVNRFLAWKLPDNVQPDGIYPPQKAREMWGPHGGPIGTNLLDATAAKAMFEHVLAGYALSPARSGEAVAGLPATWREFAESVEDQGDGIAATYIRNCADQLSIALGVIAPRNESSGVSPGGGDEVPCSTHPDAPHGYDRNGSHNADRYVCECEGWIPPTPAPQDSVRVGDGDMREALRLCYVELFHCAQQLKDAGRRVAEGGSVQTALNAGKAALEATTPAPAAGADGESANGDNNEKVSERRPALSDGAGQSAGGGR